jgi:hypothetical protein
VRARFLVAALGFIAMAAAAALVLRRAEEPERSAAAARPAARPGAGFDALEVRARGQRTVLRRRGGDAAPAFEVTAPIAYPADANAARAAWAALAKLEFLDLVTDRRARHAELEVDDAGKGVRVIAGASAAPARPPLLDLIVGKAENGATMVRLSGRDEVWQVTGEIRELFDKATFDWRDRTITAFDAREARALEIRASDGASITLEKTGLDEIGHELWKVTASTAAIDKLDLQVPRQLVAALASWQTSGFADGLAATAAGLEPPALSVTVRLGGAKAVTVLVGRAAGADASYVKAADAPQVFLVKRFNLERVNRRPIQFRDKTLCDISEDDVVEVAVSRGADSYTLARRAGGPWSATRPRGLVVNPERASAIASAFRGWAASAIAEDAPPDAVARPWAVITGRSRRASCAIAAGKATSDEQSYYVRAGASPAVHLVPKWMIDRFAMKL